MAGRPHGSQENLEDADDRPSLRKKGVLFCFTCAKPGHGDDDCPAGAQSRETPSNETNSLPPSSAEDTLASNEVERPMNDRASGAGPSSSIFYSRSMGKKSKGTKTTSHEALEKLYTTGEKSRNPVGANFASYHYDNVNVSDESFHHSKAETFEEFGLHEDILSVVKKLGYTTPLPIQKYAFSIINSGRSLKASARTGCGKTAAFLLPVINNVLKSDVRTRKNFPQYPKALIITPTRELAQQIFNDATKFAARTDIKICVCHGSALLTSEMHRIETGTNILIGTLGRTVDHLRRKHINLDELRYLVFDEADRIMDEDFAESIEELMEHIRATGHKPQTLMFSATFADRIVSKIDSLFADHVELRVGILGSVNDDIQQRVLLVRENEKKDKLLEIIRDEQSSKVKTIVFVRSRERAEMLSDFLYQNKVLVGVLHGERDQYERTKALRDFNNGTRNVMVATLLANRGLDVNLVNHVINFDLPGTIEQYVNCLGRTGRVGNSGRATSFFDPHHRDDQAIATGLRLKLQDAGVAEIPDFLPAENPVVSD